MTAMTAAATRMNGNGTPSINATNAGAAKPIVTGVRATRPPTRISAATTSPTTAPPRPRTTPATSATPPNRT